MFASSVRLSSFFATVLFMGLGLSAHAADNTPMDSKMNSPAAGSQEKIQMHEHMADMHKKAAECLKSGKTEKDCRDSMMTECKEMKRDMDCPMMTDMDKMHKNMHAKMKNNKSTEDYSDHH